MPKASHGKHAQNSRKKVTFATDVDKREIMREARRIKLEESGEQMDTSMVQTDEKVGDNVPSTAIEGPTQEQARTSKPKSSASISTKSKDCTVKEESNSVSTCPTNTSSRSRQKLKSSRPDVKLRRLKSIPDILKELYKIWEKDNRVPTVDSRREWAYARGVQPELVGNWFSVRRRKALKAGQSCEGTYSLDVSAPYNENKENVGKMGDGRADATIKNPTSETPTTTRDRKPLVLRSTPIIPIPLKLHSPPSTPPLSFGLSSPRSSSPLFLPSSLPLSLSTPIPITEKSFPPSERMSSESLSQAYDFSSYTQPWNAFGSDYSASRLQFAQHSHPTRQTQGQMSWSSEEILNPASDNVALRNPPPLDSRELAYNHIGEHRVCPGNLQLHMDCLPFHRCTLCKADFMEGHRNRDKGDTSQTKVTYELTSQPGLLYPLYDDCAMNPLLADKTSDNTPPLDVDIIFSSYDNMELSGLPFWNLVESLPSSILDPVDSKPAYCRQLQLIEELLSVPISSDEKEQQKAYNKKLAQELNLEYPSRF